MSYRLWVTQTLNTHSSSFKNSFKYRSLQAGGGFTCLFFFLLQKGENSERKPRHGIDGWGSKTAAETAEEICHCIYIIGLVDDKIKILIIIGEASILGSHKQKYSIIILQGLRDNTRGQEH